MRFRYLRDPLFLFCFALYFVNRLVLKPHLPEGILRDFAYNSLNDVICIPFWVPIMVWMMRKTRLRTTDSPPLAAEILVPVLLWSWFFELILPHIGPFQHIAVGDPNDIFCYTIGALFAALFWQAFYKTGERAEPMEEPGANRGAQSGANL